MQFAKTIKFGADGRGTARIGSLLAIGALLFAASTSNGYAQEIDSATKAHAQRLAIGVCGSCHGSEGRSQIPKYPRLAGQNAKYLAAQLRAFKGQTRGDPDAVGYMWGMAGNLDEPVIDALGEYYAAQRPAPGIPGNPTLVAQGQQIYQSGVPDKGVPACASCHGPDAHGTAEFPRLAGQHSQYLIKQLSSFSNNMRNQPVMHVVAQDLSQAQLKAVAEFLQAQP